VTGPTRKGAAVVIGDEGSRPVADLIGLFERRGVEHATFSSVSAALAARPGREALAGAPALIDARVATDREREVDLGMAAGALPNNVLVLAACHAVSATRLAAVTEMATMVGFALMPPSAERKLVECALPLGLSIEDGESGEQGIGGGAEGGREVRIRDAAEMFWRSVGLAVEWVDDGAGMIVPRVIACLANEAAFAVMEGAASIEDIDMAMRAGTRYPRGPLEWCDAVGAPEIVAILDGLAREHGEDRYRVAPLLRRLAESGTTWSGLATARRSEGSRPADRRAVKHRRLGR